MLRRAWLTAASLVFAAGAPAAAAEGDAVRVTLTGPGTPYASVRYEIEERRGTVSASVTKVFAGDFGFEEKVGLLPSTDFEALLGELEALQAFTLPSTRGPARRARYLIEVRRGSRSHRIEVHDPAQLPDGRYRALIDRVRSVTRTVAGRIPFRDAMLLPAEAGLLRIRSRPAARVTIDGLQYGETTPVEGLPLPAGRHTVRLTAVDEPLERTYEIRIEAGKTTRLAVDLR